MNFLKEPLGEQLYNQVEAKLKDSKVQLADISSGMYVSKEEYDAKVNELLALEAKYLQEIKKLQDELKQQQYDFAIKEHISKLKFSSEGAKKAFVTDLLAKNLPIQNGVILGFDDFVKSYKEIDPEAFASDEKIPKFVDSTSANIMHDETKTPFNFNFLKIRGNK